MLKLPYRHRKAIRNTNLVERMFVEERRRTRVIPKSQKEQKQIEQLRTQLNQKEERFSAIKKGLRKEVVNA